MSDFQCNAALRSNFLYSQLPPSFMSQTIEDKVNIWYYVDGQRGPEYTRIGRSDVVGTLKKAIKLTEHLPYGDSALIVWKLDVNTPVKGCKSQLQGKKISDIATMLDSSDKISTVFPGDPVDGLLHVIVETDTRPFKRLRTEANVITSPPTSAGTLAECIQQTLAEIRPQIEEFVRSRASSQYWTPPDHISDIGIRNFLTNLKIPVYASGSPSLLFHNLDYEGDDKIVNEIFGGYGTSFVCNTSGSGKTRKLLEGLTRYWGFYFVAAKDVHGVGISDMSQALTSMPSYDGWTSDLRSVPMEERAHYEEKNKMISTRLLLKLFAARALVFDLFLKVCEEVDGALTKKHKYLWLKFQLFETIGFPGPHPFVYVLNQALVGASQEYLRSQQPHSFVNINKCLQTDRFVYVIDEAQCAARTYPSAFLSSSNSEYSRSVLREIARVAAQSPAKLVFAGTGLSLEEVDLALTSGASKSTTGDLTLVHDLGGFDDWTRMEPFIRRYVPDSVLGTPAGGLLQHRIRQYLTGRYRFVTSFLEHFMRNGFQSPQTLLNAYFEALTKLSPGDGECGATEPPLQVKVQLQSFEWGRLSNDQNTLQEIRTVLQSHLTSGKTPTFGPVNAKAVEYGIARLREGHTGYIVEPLPFLAVLQWFQELGNDVGRGLRGQLARESSRGDGFEQLMILHLIRTFSVPFPLNRVFQFHGTAPVWGSENVYLVGRVEEKYVRGSILTDQPLNPKITVAHYADTIEDVLEWLEEPPDGSADAPWMLIPGVNFGPDLMARVKIVDGPVVLLMGQMKSCLEGNANSLGADTMLEAIQSLDSNNWFKKAKASQRDELIKAVNHYPVLRFVGGYPLPPDLNLRSRKVKEAITALGAGIALAVVAADSLRANFTAEREAENVLKPVEYALSCKRQGRNSAGTKK